jgi:hypothetical protein
MAFNPIAEYMKYLESYEVQEETELTVPIWLFENDGPPAEEYLTKENLDKLFANKAVSESITRQIR